MRPRTFASPALAGISLALVLAAGCSSSAGNGGTGTPAANTCPAPTGAPTTHAGFVSADETWGPGLHTVTANVTVRAGVTLTIAPCAVVRLAKDVNLEVDDEAKGLVAEGTATEPIVFERANAAEAWGAVLAWAPATARLAYATLRGGGTTKAGIGADLGGATLAARSQQATRMDVLAVDHVTVEGSSGVGVLLDSTGFVAGSRALTVTDSGSYPVYLGAAFATNLPDGVYAPNGEAAFLLQSIGPGVYDSADPIFGDVTLRNRGLPYAVGSGFSSIEIGDGRSESPKGTLTIEPGVELRFKAASSGRSQLRVRSHRIAGKDVAQGALIANGTAAAPIVFTSQSATPAAGDWQGLYFENQSDPRNSVQYARIAGAGADSTSTGLCVSTPGAPNYDADCSVILWLDDAPPSAFITNTTIEDGRGCGVYRAWKGSSVDFTATNTFRRLTGCAQSNVAPLSGTCDTTGPCR
jgi:hypothetical protein